MCEYIIFLATNNLQEQKKSSLIVIKFIALYNCLFYDHEYCSHLIMTSSTNSFFFFVLTFNKIRVKIMS